MCWSDEFELLFLQPDTGEATRKQKLDLVKIARDFCNKKEEPPQELVTSLINLLREAEDDKLAMKVISWTNIEYCVDNVTQ